MKLIIAVLILFIFLSSIPNTTNAQELGQFEPPITISNVTSVSFTVSWFSDGVADQAILFGTQEPLGSWAVDDRGIGIQRGSHHITLARLSPATEYLFRINDKGKTYKQKTAPRLNGLAPLPEVFKGTVLTEDKTVPAEAIIYMKIEGAEVLSTVTGPDGSFRLRTVGIRTDDLARDFILKETNFVNIFVRAGFEGEGAMRIFAFARANPITLNLQELRIPFYKIQFPDGIQNAPEVVSPSPAAANTSVTPASDEGFFGTLWKRVRDIF